MIETISSVITNAINTAHMYGRNGKGCVIVAASGNDGVLSAIEFPASVSDLAVGAIDSNGARAVWDFIQASNYGPGLDVVAPGTNIYTTDRQGSVGYVAGDYYANFSGTSAAAPHVAGIAALVLSVNPNLTYTQVANAITSTADRYPNWHNQYGYGLVNAERALFGYMSISGKDSPIINTNERYIASTPHSGAFFSYWSIEGGAYRLSGSIYNNTLNISFSDAKRYTITAHYILPGGSSYSTKMEVDLAPAPIPVLECYFGQRLSEPYLSMLSPFGSALTIYWVPVNSIAIRVTNAVENAMYEWQTPWGTYIEPADMGFSKDVSPSYPTLYEIKCRARKNGATTDWVTIYVYLSSTLPSYRSAPVTIDSLGTHVFLRSEDMTIDTTDAI